jgi:hypothetical protein
MGVDSQMKNKYSGECPPSLQDLEKLSGQRESSRLLKFVLPPTIRDLSLSAAESLQTSATKRIFFDAAGVQASATKRESSWLLRV